MDLTQIDFKTLTQALLQKKISAVEIAQFFLDRVDKLDSQLNSFTHVNKNIFLKFNKLESKMP